MFLFLKLNKPPNQPTNQPHAGIFVRYGYWFNLNTQTWSLRTPPPLTYLSATSQPNGLVSWRGRPTYFGFPECDGTGECHNTRIIQVRGWEQQTQIQKTLTSAYQDFWSS